VVDWSPDGRRIAFDRFGADGFADVYVMNSDGSGMQCLTCEHAALGLPAGHKGNPVWHPGGNWIVFQAEMTSHLGGSDITRPGYGFFNELWAIRADGAAVHRILELTITTAAQGTLHPCFDAAGDRLAWSHLVKGLTAGDPNLSSGEWRMCVAPFNFVNDVPTLGNWREYVPGVPAFYETHAFTADGSGLLFSGNLDAGQTLLGIDEVILELASGAIRRRVTDTPLEWDEHAHFCARQRQHRVRLLARTAGERDQPARRSVGDRRERQPPPTHVLQRSRLEPAPGRHPGVGLHRRRRVFTGWARVRELLAPRPRGAERRDRGAGFVGTAVTEHRLCVYSCKRTNQ
jgi:hypothetical protein